ncbi:tetratricopeptide repeat protein 14 isoform X2 [Latimeria chalumnae]|uniref:Tetratricopeptide repeat domain 14 n=1 Tax=Latimeria chalumnae TaxID=7897 RepID=H3AWT1_LATCH|nr:PREDICTED: tetratricopeptide repeat protein 14 isoform X2 [Latimeria chalumnae]|eukprot:XP_014341537.1 PREDICTED: tetratricopeptide repeat protein 14 isoform X2 [Latimeria chalumnae]
MNRDLLRQALGYHGPSLFSLLKCEQHENPDFQALSGEVSKSLLQRKERRVENVEVQQFIGRKADLLFASSWKSDLPKVSVTNEESEDYYAIMPPLEQFMEVPSRDKRDMFFRDIERGDIVIGRINSIREFGFFITLISLGSGGDVTRDIEHLELTALCPLRDVPSHGNHDDPLSYYQIGDLIQAVVKDIDRYSEKLTMSLHVSALPSKHSYLKLGVISSEDLPVHYRRSVTVASSTTETYDKVLQKTLGFANPSTVEFLLGQIGISEVDPPSLMRGLQSKNFSGEDYASALRKKQSASWALKCVKIGVDHFKAGRHVDAMNEYNKALEIDANNVEALVARGALYATKGSLNKAIDDFELALEACPTHRNARKYLCQTLVERGGQLEEEEKLFNAENYYKKALSVDETFQEAEDALQRLKKLIQRSLKMREEEAAKEKQKEKVKTSAEKLRKLLKQEKRVKKKRKRSSSSSDSSLDSSSTSASSLSSSSSHKKYRKRRKKYIESSHAYKKDLHRSSSREEKSWGNKEDWYPPPSDTSASFLNQKEEVEKLLERQDRSANQSEFKEKGRYRSFSSSSVEILDSFAGRSEDSRDSYSSSKTQGSVSKSEKQLSTKKQYDQRRDSSEAYRRNSYDSGRSEENYRPEREMVGKQKENSSRKLEESHKKCSASSAGSEYAFKPAERSRTESRDSWSRDSSSKCSSTKSEDKREYQSSADRYKERRENETEIKTSKENIKEQWRERPQNGKEPAEGTVKKNLPQNLLEIFNQIAEFEKEKGKNIQSNQKN